MTSLQNLFVAKLPRNLTDSDLEQIFADYEPTSAKVMLDATTGKSKGFGFVLFDSVQKGEKAYKELNRTHATVNSHSFTLAIFPSKHDGRVANEVSQCLYIRNLPKELSQEEVENFLRTFGNLTYCAMREDHYGSPVWVVYAEYENVEDAKNALSKLHGSRNHFENSSIAILAKYADSEEAKKERRKRREGQLGTAGGAVGPNSRNRGGGGAHEDSEGASSPAPQANGVVAEGHGSPSPQQHCPPTRYSDHFYKGASSHGMGAARPMGGSAPDLYMPVSNDAGSDGGANAYGSEETASPVTPLQHSYNGVGTRCGAGAHTSAPSYHFAPHGRPPHVSNVPSSNGYSIARSSSFDSSCIGAFSTHTGTTALQPRQQHRPYPSMAADPAGMRLYGGESGHSAQNGGNASSPTPLSQSFLGVTFPANSTHFEQSSNDHGTPTTPLSFNFETDMDGQPQYHSGMGNYGGGYAPNGSSQDRTPLFAASTLSAKSLAIMNSSGTRYRHNPYAPVTPISSAPSSAGPSTPRAAMGSPHTASGGGCGPGLANMAPPGVGATTSPIHVAMHFGNSHAHNGGAMPAGGHFCSTDANGYLAVPEQRVAPQQQ